MIIGCFLDREKIDGRLMISFGDSTGLESIRELFRRIGKTRVKVADICHVAGILPEGFRRLYRMKCIHDGF